MDGCALSITATERTKRRFGRCSTACAEAKLQREARGESKEAPLETCPWKSDPTAMIRIERHQDTRIIHVSVDGHPAPAEMERIVARLEEMIRRQEVPRFLFHLGHHCGIHAEALLAEVLIRHWAAALEETSSNDPVPERIAFVGDEAWHTWATEIIRPVIRPEVRFYTPDEEADAEVWLGDARGIP